MPNEDSTSVGLDPEDLDSLKEERFLQLRDLLHDFVEQERSGKKFAEEFDANDRGKGRHVPAWTRVAAAYNALRACWVVTPGRRRIRDQYHPKGDPAVRAKIMRWCQGIGDFRRDCYGPGAPEEVRSVLLLYRRTWSKWHKRCDRYRKQDATAARRRRAAKKAAWKAAST